MRSYFFASKFCKLDITNSSALLSGTLSNVLSVGDELVVHLATVKTAGVHHTFKIEGLNVLFDGGPACWALMQFEAHLF